MRSIHRRMSHLQRIATTAPSAGLVACAGNDTANVAPSDVTPSAGGASGTGGGGSGGGLSGGAGSDAGRVAETGANTDSKAEEVGVVEASAETSSDAGNDGDGAIPAWCRPNACCLGPDDVYPAGHLKPGNECMACVPEMNRFDFSPVSMCMDHMKGCACAAGTPVEVDCADRMDNDGNEGIDCMDPDCDGKA